MNAPQMLAAARTAPTVIPTSMPVDNDGTADVDIVESAPAGSIMSVSLAVGAAVSADDTVAASVCTAESDGDAVAGSVVGAGESERTLLRDAMTEVEQVTVDFAVADLNVVA